RLCILHVENHVGLLAVLCRSFRCRNGERDVCPLRFRTSRLTFQLSFFATQMSTPAKLSTVLPRKRTFHDLCNCGCTGGVRWVVSRAIQSVPTPLNHRRLVQ